MEGRRILSLVDKTPAGVQKAVDELKADDKAFWSKEPKGPQVTYIVVGKRYDLRTFLMYDAQLTRLP